MGNLQVRFLEGWAPAMAPGYSTLGISSCLSKSPQSPQECHMPVSIALSEAQQRSMSELGHLATHILLACRSRDYYRLDQSRQIHAVPKSDQPAQCELETLDAMSCLAPACEMSHNARQRRPQTRG